MKRMVIIAAALISSNLWAGSNDSVMNQIRVEGLEHSQVMETLRHLTDEIGPRLTGSPELKQANNWTKQQLQDWGLKNAKLQGFDFGRGWNYQSVMVQLKSPRQLTLHAIPVAWTPASNGTITAEVVLLDAVNKEELAKYKGKLAGKIVLMSEPRAIKPPKNEVYKREDGKSLASKKKFNMDRPASHRWTPLFSAKKGRARYQFRQQVADFLKAEGALAAVYRSWRDGGLISVWGANHKVGKTFPIPAVIIEAEQYQLISRMMDAGHAPQLSINVEAKFYDDDHKAYNTLADIPGHKKRSQIVMLGGHLDSWHGNTGAVDNAAGVAVTMEAVRILSSLKVKMDRTVRIGLWSGEEQGLFGSEAYVKQLLATRPAPRDKKIREMPHWYWDSPGWPITKKKGYDKFSVYFNVDNGSGKFRGIYTEGNIAAKSLFSRWFSPFSDMTDGTVTNNATGGTDHESFDDIGLPGFQFIQDPLDYGSRLHHTNLDAYDHASANDLKQAATILAGFVYQAATMKDNFPREPMPQAPTKAELEKAKREAAKQQRKMERDANRYRDL